MSMAEERGLLFIFPRPGTLGDALKPGSSRVASVTDRCVPAVRKGANDFLLMTADSRYNPARAAFPMGLDKVRCSGGARER